MAMTRCLGCMTPTDSYPCPHCGYDCSGQPSYALPLGTILRGRYLVGKVLGQGGFGLTYIGWDLALNRKIAVKEYYPSGQVMRNGMTSTLLHWNESAQSRELRSSGMESFLKEARKMARIDDVAEATHVRDTFLENETAYIVMEFVEGKTLKELLEKRGPMPWKVAEPIFASAISAMERIHQAGIIHRDLSPDNLMIQADGTVKILDLGAAKDLSVNTGASSMLVAKGGFSPIEQYSHRGGSGPYSDVYAMAATMYYTITGTLPPTAVDRIDADGISWKHEGLQALPKHVLEALKNALVVSAKDRTQTMADFLRELQDPRHARKKKKKGHSAVGGILIGLAITAVLAVAALFLVPPLAPEVVEQLGYWPFYETVPPTTAPTAPPTEAITMPETEAPTEAPTEAATEAPTEAPTIGPTEPQIVPGSGSCGNSAQWALDSDGVLRILGSGYMENYPDGNTPWKDQETLITTVVVGNDITSVGDYAFTGCTNLVDAQLPTGITYFGIDCFKGCGKLAQVTIPKGIGVDGKFHPVTKIYRYEEYGSCGNNLSWHMDGTGRLFIYGTGDMYNYDGNMRSPWFNYGNGNKITTVIISDGITSIGDEAFSGCTSLRTINLPDTITRIGSYVFQDTNLRSLTLPKNLQTLEAYCFFLCRFSAIEIPEGVTYIPENAFTSCTSLANVTLPDGLLAIGQHAFHGCYNLTSLHIPETVTQIGGWAFQDCSRLSSINIPEGITELKQGTFHNCELLKKITLPEGLLSLETDCFRSTGLTSIRIPPLIKKIPGNTFLYCKLASIEMPQGCTYGEGNGYLNTRITYYTP